MKRFLLFLAVLSNIFNNCHDHHHTTVVVKTVYVEVGCESDFDCGNGYYCGSDEVCYPAADFCYYYECDEVKPCPSGYYLGWDGYCWRENYECPYGYDSCGPDDCCLEYWYDGCPWGYYALGEFCYHEGTGCPWGYWLAKNGWCYTY